MIGQQKNELIAMQYAICNMQYAILSKFDPLRFWVLNVVAHEVAHQWFGNIVSLDW